MTAKLSFGSWTAASGWSTALASVADAGNSTSGQVNNSSQLSEMMDVAFAYNVDTSGSGVIELWLLPEGNDGSAQDANAPPYGGLPIMVVPTAADTTQRMQVVRVFDLPEKFKFYVNNQAGDGLGAGTFVYYRFVDLTDV